MISSVKLIQYDYTHTYIHTLLRHTLSHIFNFSVNQFRVSTHTHTHTQFLFLSRPTLLAFSRCPRHLNFDTLGMCVLCASVKCRSRISALRCSFAFMLLPFIRRFLGGDLESANLLTYLLTPTCP